LEEFPLDRISRPILTTFQVENMPKLPVVSGVHVVRVLESLGFELVRQCGTNLVLRRGSSGCVVQHHEELRTVTLAGILKQAGVSIEDFLSIVSNAKGANQEILQSQLDDSVFKEAISVLESYTKDPELRHAYDMRVKLLGHGK
jgi:predicted RNA binding protein YcfA (HicA-like mRNA interferase family)